MIIDSKSIKLQSHIAEKIKDFLDELRTKEMIQKFLGCLNYSSDFIKDFAKERHELQKLLSKKNQTGWSKKHTIIVKRLKNICSGLPKLRLPNENDNLILQTDASDKFLSYYYFEIVHIKDTDNFLADFLRRNVE